jgi:hypothetical protein
MVEAGCLPVSIWEFVKSPSETREIPNRTKPDGQQGHVNDLQFESLEQEERQHHSSQRNCIQFHRPSDFDRRVIHVRRSAWYGRVQTVKSKASRAPVAMSEALSALLKEYLATWKPNPAGFLFLNRNGSPYAANKVVAIWPLARAGQAGNRTRWNARIRALPREFADGGRSESDRGKRADATLGCANHAGNLRARDR